MASKYYNSLRECEQDFCILLVEGSPKFAGNPTQCYIETVGKKEGVPADDPFIGHYVKELLSDENIKGYIKELQKDSEDDQETELLKIRLRSTLLKIIDECSEAQFTDRRGNKLSPAAMRSVANNSIKTLIDITPALKKEVEAGEDDDKNKGGLTFNVIVPDKPVKTKEQLALEESVKNDNDK